MVEFETSSFFLFLFCSSRMAFCKNQVMKRQRTREHRALILCISREKRTTVFTSQVKGEAHWLSEKPQKSGQVIPFHYGYALLVFPLQNGPHFDLSYRRKINFSFFLNLFGKVQIQDTMQSCLVL